MEETEYRQVYPVDKAVAELEAAVKLNKFLAPGVRNDCITFVKEEKKPESLMVNGSAHVLKPLFVELFKKRPELRFVVQEALDSMYKIATE